MKIFDTEKIREADSVTITKQCITSLQLMERAGHEAFLWLKNKFPDKETVFHAFCGSGNNGGDGLVIARLLKADGYKTLVDIVDYKNPTADFLASLQKIKDAGMEYNNNPDSYDIRSKTVIIDALFGTGLSRPLTEEIVTVIDKINNSKTYVVAVDMPSGMFMDKKTTVAVKANVVLTFQSPKLALYLPDNHEFVQQVKILDIGLDKDFIANTPSDYHLIDKAEAKGRYRPVSTYAHKGTQGHALIIGGSYGKIGAALLSAKAALKSGCGLVTAYIPKCGYNTLQSAFPEAMVLTDGEEHITGIGFELQPKAIGIGMGMGQHAETQQALHDFLQRQQAPLVIDADALNILSYNKEWLKLLPENTILTPHPKELERLIGKWEGDFEKLTKMRFFCELYNVVLVTKGAYTMTAYKGTVYINASGNAALATAGSGDVLTGSITGLLAQGYNPVDAAIFGVYLHGLTADIAVADTGMQAFTASTILDYIGKAYLNIEAENL